MSMSFGKALAWGLALSLVATVALLVVGFVGGVSLSVPGVVELSSANDGAPQSEMSFNPLAVVLLALVVASMLWGLGKVRARSHA